MKNDRDARDAILLLVDACNDYQIRSLTLSAAFRGLQLRANPCECELQSEILKAYKHAEALVEGETKEIKSALEGSGPFLEVLKTFATRHYSEFAQFLQRPGLH